MKLNVVIIRQLRRQSLSFRQIGKAFGISHARVWNILNAYQWRKTKNGKAYENHRNHLEIKDNCVYCELEKRKHALHSKESYISL